MTKAIENLFIYTAIYISVPFFLLFGVYFKQVITNRLLKVIALYLGIEFLTDQIALHYDTQEKVVFFAYSLFTCLEVLFFSYLFVNLLKNERVKKVIPSIAIVFIIFEFIYYLTAKKRVIDTIPIGVETVIMICYSCFFLFEQAEDFTTTTFIYDRYSFWLISGILVYLAGSCFIYMSANLVDPTTRSGYWLFTNVFLIIKKIMFAISVPVFVSQFKKVSQRRKFLSNSYV